ncbi:DUF1697 domain-containing protein [Lapillicoccus sp.]|uniref:DUF1697 domain-containing protein n=1 Tax=Lapillicoccus sp. TaxID=1909287 RepID=UPI0032656FEB
MAIQVGFLRAVNLGKRRVPMARLVEVCTDLGHASPWTFVNSGNVVFEAPGRRASLEKGLESALEDEFGFECTTFVRSAAQLRTALALAPFTVGSGDTYFVTFLKAKPSGAAAHALEALSNEFETLVVDGCEVHWRMHGKSTDSQLVKRDWERILGVNTSTSRNTTMLTKLLAKIDA